MEDKLLSKLFRSISLFLILGISIMGISTSFQHLFGMVLETKSENYMYETLISYTDYHEPYYKRVGKVTRFFEAEYWVCFKFETHTLCSNNQTVFNANKFDDMWNIVVNVDIITDINTNEFVRYENALIILDY